MATMMRVKRVVRSRHAKTLKRMPQKHDHQISRGIKTNSRLLHIRSKPVLVPAMVAGSALAKQLRRGAPEQNFRSLIDSKSWNELECDRFYRHHELKESTWSLSSSSTQNETSSPVSACPRACVGSWQPGEWVQWCPEDERDCGSTFIPSSKDCLHYFYDRAETASCLKDSWVIMLGSSGVTNL
eukprot:254559-Hanusia_phi.AAC.1